MLQHRQHRLQPHRVRVSTPDTTGKGHKACISITAQPGAKPSERRTLGTAHAPSPEEALQGGASTGHAWDGLWLGESFAAVLAAQPGGGEHKASITTWSRGGQPEGRPHGLRHRPHCSSGPPQCPLRDVTCGRQTCAGHSHTRPRAAAPHSDHTQDTPASLTFPQFS